MDLDLRGLLLGVVIRRRQNLAIADVSFYGSDPAGDGHNSLRFSPVCS